MSRKIERKSKMVGFPVKLAEAVEEYQEQNAIPSFTGAVLELVRKALIAEGLF